MDQDQRNQIKKAFREAFDENVQHSGFDVQFNEVDSNTENAAFEGVYEFHLTGSSPAECIKSLGGQVGENFHMEDEQNTIEVYIGDEESAVVAFDGFRTLDFQEHDEDDAEEMGISLAESLNNAINQIIDESRKKRSSDDLPLGARPLK